MAIEIREVRGDRKRTRDFLDVVRTIYAGDASYVRPLDMEVEATLDPKKNPFYEHGEAAAFVAYDGGKPVGRITASIDFAHLERYRDDTGFFGFFETTDDPAVAAALLREAERWLSARGMKRARGPLNLSMNGELGCLVEGFDEPPMLMMTHHRPYQGSLAERAGYVKAKDFYAWKYIPGEVPVRAQRAHDEIAALPEVVVRQVDTSDVLGDVRIIMDIFNDAWSDNWGFVPATEKEMLKMAEDMKLVLMPEIAFIVSIDGEPAAVSVGLPNVNELIDDLDGKLGPLGVAKILWRLKVRGPKSGRLFILGIKKKWRGVRKYAGLSAYLYVKMNQAAHYLGMKRAELSWTVEDNAPINSGIKLMGGKIYKVYRLYERALA
jgi:hypothetical protein